MALLPGLEGPVLHALRRAMQSRLTELTQRVLDADRAGAIAREAMKVGKLDKAHAEAVREFVDKTGALLVAMQIADPPLRM